METYVLEKTCPKAWAVALKELPSQVPLGCLLNERVSQSIHKLNRVSGENTRRLVKGHAIGKAGTRNTGQPTWRRRLGT